jgi:hypothetical protein
MRITTKTPTDLIAVDVVIRDEALDGSDGFERTLACHLLQKFFILLAVPQKQVNALG